MEAKGIVIKMLDIFMGTILLFYSLKTQKVETPDDSTIYGANIDSAFKF